MKKVLLTSAVLLASLGAQGAIVKGTLSGTDPGNVMLTSIENGKNVQREVIMADRFKYTLDSKMLNSPNYVLEFIGEVTDTQIITDRTPTIVAGIDAISGKLITDGLGEYYINATKVVFGRTKAIYGIPFDEASKKNYVNKEVNVQGFFQG